MFGLRLEYDLLMPVITVRRPWDQSNSLFEWK